MEIAWPSSVGAELEIRGFPSSSPALSFFNFLAAPVHSQLVRLLPVGILNLLSLFN